MPEGINQTEPKHGLLFESTKAELLSGAHKVLWHQAVTRFHSDVLEGTISLATRQPGTPTFSGAVAQAIRHSLLCLEDTPINRKSTRLAMAADAYAVASVRRGLKLDWMLDGQAPPSTAVIEARRAIERQEIIGEQVSRIARNLGAEPPDEASKIWQILNQTEDDFGVYIHRGQEAAGTVLLGALASILEGR